MTPITSNGSLDQSVPTLDSPLKVIFPKGEREELSRKFPVIVRFQKNTPLPFSSELFKKVMEFPPTNPKTNTYEIKVETGSSYLFRALKYGGSLQGWLGYGSFKMCIETVKTACFLESKELINEFEQGVLRKLCAAPSFASYASKLEERLSDVYCQDNVGFDNELGPFNCYHMPRLLDVMQIIHLLSLPSDKIAHPLFLISMLCESRDLFESRLKTVPISGDLRGKLVSEGFEFYLDLLFHDGYYKVYSDQYKPWLDRFKRAFTKSKDFLEKICLLAQGDFPETQRKNAVVKASESHVLEFLSALLPKASKEMRTSAVNIALSDVSDWCFGYIDRKSEVIPCIELIKVVLHHGEIDIERGKILELSSSVGCTELVGWALKDLESTREKYHHVLYYAARREHLAVIEQLLEPTLLKSLYPDEAIVARERTEVAMGAVGFGNIKVPERLIRDIKIPMEVVYEAANRHGNIVNQEEADHFLAIFPEAIRKEILSSDQINKDSLELLKKSKYAPNPAAFKDSFLELITIF